MESSKYQRSSPCRTFKGVFKKHTNDKNSFETKEREPPALLHSIYSSSHTWISTSEDLRDNWIIARESLIDFRKIQTKNNILLTLQYAMYIRLKDNLIE